MAREAIFIGYRREDTADTSGRIYDALERRFGRDRVFKDVDNIPPGVDFGEYIQRILPRCRVALILIGPQWLDVKDEGGRRRLDDPHDWVRIEIESALAHKDLYVVPVLVNGAQIPRTEDLPDALHPLLRRNAAVIRRDPDFRDDIDKLADALRASVGTGRPPVGPGARRSGVGIPGMLLVAALAAALGIAGILGWQVSQQEGSRQDSHVPETTVVSSIPNPTQPATAQTGETTAPPNQTQTGPPAHATPGVVVMGPLEAGVNRQGLDFSAFAPTTANAALCAEMCRVNNQCRAMTYVISQKTCWLKGGVPPPLPPGGPDYVSAVKQS
jgi:hypothetical protein